LILILFLSLATICEILSTTTYEWTNPSASECGNEQTEGSNDDEGTRDETKEAREGWGLTSNKAEEKHREERQ
jgi:hypothetical protein